MISGHRVAYYKSSYYKKIPPSQNKFIKESNKIKKVERKEMQ